MDSTGGPNRSGYANPIIDPAKMPLWEIIRRLNTGQVCAVCLFAIGLFGAGYGIGEWRAHLSHNQEVNELKGNQRKDIQSKDATIEEKKGIIRHLETALGDATQTGQEAMRLTAGADRKARDYRGKAEFLDRYLAYLQDPAPDSAMHKLFADHVCVLWRETQRHIHSTATELLTFEDLAHGRSLTPSLIKALADVGIRENEITEYRHLNNRRSEIEPGASRMLNGNADFMRLQYLERDLRARLQKGVSTKTVTFFDGSRYEIPQPVATNVHLRTDCGF